LAFCSKAQFRILVAATIAIYLALSAIVSLRLVPYPHEIEVVRTWNHYQAIFPYPLRLGWEVADMILFLIAQIGLLFFRPFARRLLAALLVITVLMAPFMGLLVLSPLEHFVTALVGLLACLTLAIAAFSPLAVEFRSKRDIPAPALP